MDFQAFLRSILYDRNFSPTTVRAYENDLSLFSHFMRSKGITQIEEVDRSAITDYIADLKQKPTGRLNTIGLSEATISRRLAVVSNYFDFLHATKHPDLRNPVREVRRKSRKRKCSKEVDEQSLRSLLEGINVLRDKCLISLYLSTGLRLTELIGLNRKDISFQLRTDARGRQSVMGVGSVIGKGAKERAFYVDSGTLPVLAEYLASRTDDSEALFLSERRVRISPRAVQYTLAQWCKKLNLPHLHPHRLRHSFASRLANAHIDQLQLKQLMGHSDFATTLGYFKIDEQKTAQGYHAAMELYRDSV